LNPRSNVRNQRSDKPIALPRGKHDGQELFPQLEGLQKE
jgi:hypothetical protein